MATTYAPPGMGTSGVRQRRYQPLQAGQRPQVSAGIGAPAPRPQTAPMQQQQSFAQQMIQRRNAANAQNALPSAAPQAGMSDAQSALLARRGAQQPANYGIGAPGGFGGGQQGGGQFGSAGIGSPQNGGIGGPQPQQQYGYNPQQGAGTFNKAWKDYQNMPTVSDQLNNAPNPMDYYNPVMPGAQGSLNNYFGGQNGGYNPNSNPWLNQASNYMNNMPGLPGQPDLQFAPSSYQGPNAPQYNGGPQYDNMQFDKFDSSRIGGPGNSQFSDPMANAAGIGGPNTNYDQLYNSNQQPVNRIGGFGPMDAGPGRESSGGVGRENIQGSGFDKSQLFGNPNSIAQQGFQSALGGAQGQIGAGLNDDIFKQQSAALQKQLNAAGIRASVLGGEEVGGRGFVNDMSSGVSQEAYAKYYAPAQAEIGSKLADLAAGNLDRTIQQQQFGIGAATGVGSAASSSAQGNAGLLQGDNQFVGQSGITQRGQDIDQQGQRITERGQDINRGLEGRGQDVAVRGQDVNQREQDLRTGENNANRGLEVERLRTENYQAQTQRMTGMGQLVNQMEQARASNNVDAYNSATQRLQTEYGYSSDQARNQIAGYQAATQRGEVGQQAWAESQRLGFDYAGLQQRYDELAANNQNLRNTNLIDVMRTTGDQANQRVSTVLGAMGDYANTVSRDQIANMENTYKQATLAANIMQDGSQAAQFWTQSIMNATGADRDAYLRMWETWVGDQTRKNDGKFDWEGLAGDVVGGAAQLGGAAIMASDRNIKSAVEPIDGRVILDRLNHLPVSSWVYNERPDVRHVGPMAQDFREMFGLGDSDTVISTVDAVGILMAAVKELTGQVRELRNNAGLN